MEEMAIFLGKTLAKSIVNSMCCTAAHLEKCLLEHTDSI